jgi:hypothetical protein
MYETKPRRQKLSSVCNGGHIHTLNDLSPEMLKKALGDETKAILIVGNIQHRARHTLLDRRKELRALGLTAKRLCVWSNTAELFIVRKVGAKF